MKILIFTEGTAIMHAVARDVSVEERVLQSASQVEGIDDFRSYIPNNIMQVETIEDKPSGKGV